MHPDCGDDQADPQNDLSFEQNGHGVLLVLTNEGNRTRSIGKTQLWWFGFRFSFFF